MHRSSTVNDVSLFHLDTICSIIVEIRTWSHKLKNLLYVITPECGMTTCQPAHPDKMWNIFNNPLKYIQVGEPPPG